MQAIWDLEQGKYGFGMFAYSIFFPLSLSLPLSFCFLTFLLVRLGLGMTWGFFPKIVLLTCMQCLGLWFKGFGEGGHGPFNALPYFITCVWWRGARGKIRLRRCQNRIQPKGTDRPPGRPSPPRVRSNPGASGSANCKAVGPLSCFFQAGDDSLCQLRSC